MRTDKKNMNFSNTLGLAVATMILTLVVIIVGITLGVSMSKTVTQVAAAAPASPAAPETAPNVLTPEPAAAPTERPKLVVEPIKTVTVWDVYDANKKGNAWCSGNIHSKKVVFVLSSCRGIHYANYILNHDFFADCCLHLVFVHATRENSFATVCKLVPTNVLYFFHEHIIHYNFLNTDPRLSESVFQVPGLMHDQGRSIITPNMPNPLLSARDLVLLDPNIQAAFVRYQNRTCKCTSDDDCECRLEIAEHMIRRRNASIDKYASIMMRTGLVRSANFFRLHIKTHHFFNSYSHPSNLLSLIIFTELLQVHFAAEIVNPCPIPFLLVSHQPEFIGSCCDSPWTTWDRSILQYEWLDCILAGGKLADPGEILISAKS